MFSSDLLLKVLELAPDATLIVGSDGGILFASQRARALFDYATADEMLSCSIEDLMPERFRRAHVGYRSRFSAEKRSRPMGTGLELLARRKDGTDIPVEISLSPVPFQGDTLIIATVRDVTERKRAHDDLIHARQAADQARRIADAARDAAERANQAKSRFLSTASHDLRQPLQSLALLNGALRRRVHEQDAQEALAQQEQAIDAMSRLLNALLDIGKLESGAIKPDITDFNVALLFEQLRREFEALALEKGLELQVEACETTLRSDPSLLGQILRNLVSNAIKYTHRGRVILRCLCAPALARLEVADSGVGIPAQHLPYIFDEFYQIEGDQAVKRDGYGLGLSIVSRITKLLDLKLDVASEPGKGSCFRLDVPVGMAPHPRTRSAPLPTAAEPRIPVPSARVLLVEDDIGVRDATRMLLKAAGYQVVAAGTCSEALESVEAHGPFAILISDFHLGSGCTGAEVIRAIREKLGAALPAILVSGDTSTAVQQLAHDERWRIASKPIQAERLLALMDELLGS